MSSETGGHYLPEAIVSEKDEVTQVMLETLKKGDILHIEEKDRLPQDINIIGRTKDGKVVGEVTISDGKQRIRVKAWILGSFRPPIIEYKPVRTIISPGLSSPGVVQTGAGLELGRMVYAEDVDQFNKKGSYYAGAARTHEIIEKMNYSPSTENPKKK